MHVRHYINGLLYAQSISDKIYIRPYIFQSYDTTHITSINNLNAEINHFLYAEHECIQILFHPAVWLRGSKV